MKKKLYIIIQIVLLIALSIAVSSMEVSSKIVAQNVEAIETEIEEEAVLAEGVSLDVFEFVFSDGGKDKSGAILMSLAYNWFNFYVLKEIKLVSFTNAYLYTKQIPYYLKYCSLLVYT